MSKAQIDNAEEIIERFGGIRPMATKTGVAVTTVQGWKKRGTIPAARRAMIVEAAQAHEVDLSGLVDGVVAQESAKHEEVPVFKEEPKTSVPSYVEIINPKAEKAKAEPEKVVEGEAPDFAQMEKRIMKKTMVMNAAMLGVAAIAVVVLLMPSDKSADVARIQNLEDVRIPAIEKEMAVVKEEQKSLKDLIPEDLSEQLSALRAQTAEKAEAFMVENQDWSARVAELEDKISDLKATPVLENLLVRYNTFAESFEGRLQMTEAVDALAQVLQGQPEDGTVEQTLLMARTDNPALGQSFADVPPEDIKAAAILLTMAKLRGSLNRGNQSFLSDYDVLRNLVGENDPALLEALDRLSPHAQQGVLTPEGLGNELRALAGDVVVASLSGEDVSVTQRAAARLHDALQIRKDGELVTGTPTQVTMGRAESLLASGDVAGAVETLETGLEGKAAQLATPWIGQARARILADQLSDTLTSSMSQMAYGS